MDEDAPVLVVGAGPTGLVLALWLTRFGVRVRIVDKAAEPGTTSRAVAVQARTLELYRQIGLADTIVRRGLPFAAANLWVKGKHEGRVAFGDMGEGLSPYPYMLMFPQDEHERVLIERLGAAGVHVERPVELVAVELRDDRVRAQLRRADGSLESCEVAYLAACDGARSFVRHALGIGFPGGTYEHLFYVADVEAKGPQMNGELHATLDDSDFLACFPLQGRERARLIGSVQPSAADDERPPDWNAIGHKVIAGIGLDVTRVNWFSTYRVHHRVASSFRVGRAFLLGDAGHIHSPVGGQGMNTGIGDAINLAWKLAAVLQGRASGDLLDTYEEERVPFARRLVRTTDRAFTVVSQSGPIANRVRNTVAPAVLPMLFRSARVRRWMYGTISQTRISYRGARLSTGREGSVEGGDRLPWVRAANDHSDNFSPLASMTWQVHVYGTPSNALRAGCSERGLALHAFAPAPQAGLAPDAAYLVRPDGYVAGAWGDAAAAHGIVEYLESRGLRPTKSG